MRHYIRAGASGANDGSSWANAWTSFASVTWTRGDTYFIAGGVYNEASFIYIHPATSGTSTVAIKKANVSDNGSDPGWNIAYATDIAYINGPSVSPFPVLDFANGYVTIDGVTGSGTSGHGIVVYNPEHTDVVLFEAGNGYSISHCELRGAGYGGNADGYSGIQFTGGKNIYLGNCWIHNVTINGIVSSSVVGTSYSDYGFIVEGCVVSETGGCTDPDLHGQGMQLGFNSQMAYAIIRDNVFRNNVGSAMIAFLGGGSANHHDFRIYNNIFHLTDPDTYSILSPGVIWSHVDAVKTNILIANNVFYNLKGDDVSGSIILQHPSSANVLLENNIWENCRFSSAHIGITTQSNNGYYGNTGSVPAGTANQVNGSNTTFSDAELEDFNLLSSGYAVGTGADLSSVFTTDKSGTNRTTWDLGAYAFGSSAATPVFSPVAGIYEGNQVVVITCDTAGATIKYTLDETDPTEFHGTIYTVPIGLSSDSELRAVAFKEGLGISAIASASYTINQISDGGPGVSAAGLNANRINLA